MDPPDAMQIGRKIADLRENGPNLIPFACLLVNGPNMATTSGPYQIHTEARGPHWIAWMSRGDGTKPDRSIVLIGRTQAEAEERARQFAEQTQY
jgi:hypothetical protein